MNVVTLEDPDLQAKQLLSMARTRSGSGRENIQQIIDDLFHGRGNVLDRHDRAMMHYLLQGLSDEAEQELRAAIRMRCNSNAENMVFSALDLDAYPVVHPLLMHCDAFATASIVERLWHCVRQHRLSNARRAGSSASDDRVAPFPERLATPDIAQHLFLWVAAALRIDLLARNRLDEVVVDDLIEAALEDIGRTGRWSGETPSSRGRRSASSDDETRLVDLLRRGLAAEFEVEFARISGLRPQLIGRMLYERGGEALATICVAIGISKRGFAVFFIISREAMPQHPLADAQEVAHALTFYDSLKRDAANRVVARWRRGSAYLNAIRQLTAVHADVLGRHATRYPVTSSGMG